MPAWSNLYHRDAFVPKASFRSSHSKSSLLAASSTAMHRFTTFDPRAGICETFLSPANPAL
jgi:hypothetical protein